jgi:hypothetical protein
MTKEMHEYEHSSPEIKSNQMNLASARDVQKKI